MTRYQQAATFHPTFLYESLWNLALAGLILWIDRRFHPARGALALVYLAGYGLGRFLIELLRTDTTFRLLGLSRNNWVALAVCLVVQAESSVDTEGATAPRLARRGSRRVLVVLKRSATPRGADAGVAECHGFFRADH